MVTTDTTQMPPHARVIANSEVWMEGDGVLQFAKTSTLPGCMRAVAMPDLHVGKGPVGAVFATRDLVYPHLLGGDVGCGVRLYATNEDAQNRDAIERRVSRVWEEDPLADVPRAELFRAVWERGILGLKDFAELDETLLALVRLEETLGNVARNGENAMESREDSMTADTRDFYSRGYEEALGSIGGGNHFAEIARVTEVRDKAVASRLGLERGCLVVVAHSGSRGLGTALHKRWGDVTLTEPASRKAYLADVSGAVRFAQVNRLLLGYKLLRALGAARTSKLAGSFDVTHNDVRKEPVSGEEVWVHRKGAAPAYEGQPTIVLGSRGAPSWVLLGTGAEDGLRSVAHGAGRRMGRAEALSKLGHKYKRSELKTTKLGGRVMCDDEKLLYEEHPDAYKPIAPVVDSLIEAGMATAVASLVPVITIKR